MEIHYEGIGLRPEALVVFFKVKSGSVFQFREVQVPWHALATEEVGVALDTAVRRRLMEVWSGVPIDPEESLW